MVPYVDPLGDTAREPHPACNTRWFYGRSCTMRLVPQEKTARIQDGLGKSHRIRSMSFMLTRNTGSGLLSKRGHLERHSGRCCRRRKLEDPEATSQFQTGR